MSDKKITINFSKQELNYLITALGVADLNYGLSETERELFNKLVNMLQEEC